MTGTRSYNSAADYTYYATSAQNTGNGLPSTVHNLTINNSSGVTLSEGVSASNIITLTTGIVSTGLYELGTTNTATSAIVGYNSTNYINGYLRRSVAASGAYDFPVGNSSNYELASITFSSQTGVSSVLGSFTHATVIDDILYPLIGIFVNGTPITDMLNYGYWTLTPNSVMTGGTYSVALNEAGHTNSSTNAQSYCVLKRVRTVSPWQSLGTHDNSTQSEIGGIAKAVRSGLTGFSDFGVG